MQQGGHATLQCQHDANEQAPDALQVCCRCSCISDLSREPSLQLCRLFMLSDKGHPEILPLLQENLLCLADLFLFLVSTSQY